MENIEFSEKAGLEEIKMLEEAITQTKKRLLNLHAQKLVKYEELIAELSKDDELAQLIRKIENRIKTNNSITRIDIMADEGRVTDQDLAERTKLYEDLKIISAEIESVLVSLPPETKELLLMHGDISSNKLKLQKIHHTGVTPLEYL